MYYYFIILSFIYYVWKKLKIKRKMIKNIKKYISLIIRIVKWVIFLNFSFFKISYYNLRQRVLKFPKN